MFVERTLVKSSKFERHRKRRWAYIQVFLTSYVKAAVSRIGQSKEGSRVIDISAYHNSSTVVSENLVFRITHCFTLLVKSTWNNILFHHFYIVSCVQNKIIIQSV